MTLFILLVILALICVAGSFIRPAWPLLAVAVLLVCVALLLGGAGQLSLTSQASSPAAVAVG